MSDPIAGAAVAAQTTREIFLKQYAKMLSCPADEYSITCKLINESKNFQTAVCILFGLSLRTHKEYIHECADYWKKNWVADAICDNDYCAAFQKHYTEEVKPYPSDA
jgi:hypothetical protein